MKERSRFLVLPFLILFAFVQPSYAAWVWSPESGKFVKPEDEVQGTPQELYDRGVAAIQKKEWKEASEKFRSLLKKYPSAQMASEAQYRLGIVYEAMGEFYRAFRSYKDLVQKYPQSERVSESLKREFRIGNLFLSGRKAKFMGLEVLPALPRAVEVFKHLVDTSPYSEFGDQAQFHLGLAYKKSGLFDEAKKAFQALVDNYPQSPLVPQAHFQIADTSYVHSVTATRDQRVVDEATEEIDHFLQQYPDSNVSDKAAKLRQEIDEKNAEKNYRIARFYEKENYLDSAFIYYRDVARRYPHTSWGIKAEERLSALERPAEFLKAQEAEVVAKKEQLLGELETVGKADPARRQELEEQIKRVEKTEKEVRKSKPETLKRRRAALDQKENELKEKVKALRKKKKRFSKNASEDLSLAFERWEASLEKEKAELIREKFMIKEWERALGVRTTSRLAALVPFRKEAPSPLEQVQRTEAERLEELARERKQLLKEKEGLYREYEKLLSSEGLLRAGDRVYETKQEKLARETQEIERLERKLKVKEQLYKKEFGISPLQAAWEVPKTVVGRSVDLLNPFAGNASKEWESKSADELKALQHEWREKLANQKEIVETISQAFDDELARAEEKRLVRELEQAPVDSDTLRRGVKQLEREIRSHYNEIQDRNKRKNEILEELNRIIRQKEEGEGLVRAGNAVTAPVRGAFYLSRAFFFGLPERDVEISEKAEKLSNEGEHADEIRALREQVQLESLLIEARNQEIKQLERDVEALRAQASLLGAPRFRSLLVKFPYVFVREAIQSANRLVPKRDRRERLIEQLNRESEKLEALKQDLTRIENLLKENPQTETPKPAISEPPPAAPEPQDRQGAGKPELSRALLREEIRSLAKQLAVKKEAHKLERENLEQTRWDKISKSQGKARSQKLKGVETGLAHLIEEEQKLHEEEVALLVKKKEMVEQMLGELPRDLFEKDLLLKKEEIESRLNEIQRREMTLGEELKRVRPPATPQA